MLLSFVLGHEKKRNNGAVNVCGTKFCLIGVNLLGDMGKYAELFEKLSMFCEVAVPFYILIDSEQVFPFLHILVDICDIIFYFFHFLQGW